jgi:hypothetical protein
MTADAFGRGRCHDRGSGVGKLLGADAAVALEQWARRNGAKVHLPAQRWRAAGYTGAVLTALYVTGPKSPVAATDGDRSDDAPSAGSQLVVVKLLASDQAVEPERHTQALRDCTPSFRRHLVEQLLPPLRVAGDKVLMFQGQAGDSSIWKPIANLAPTALPRACAVVTRALIADWNPTPEVRTRSAVDYLHGELERTDSTRHHMTSASDRQAVWVRFDDDPPVPNPSLLGTHQSLLAGVDVDLICGQGHGDLHTQNILLRQERDVADPDTFVLVDLMTYQRSCPLDRDPVTLLLSALTSTLGDSSAQHRRLILDVVIDPESPSADLVPAAATATVRAVYGTAEELLKRRLGREAWRRQYLLSLIARGLIFSTFENLGPARRWWFHQLAAYAAGALVTDLGIHPAPKQAPGVSNPFDSAVVDGPAHHAQGSGPSDRRHGGGRVSFSGSIKVDVCRLLYQDWTELADYLDVPAYERARFGSTRPAAELWEWLERRDRLADLSPALRTLGFDKAADVLDSNASY